MNKVQTWEFALAHEQTWAKNVREGQEVVGSIGEINASNEPQRFAVALSVDSHPIGAPPSNMEAEIIQLVGRNKAVILKGHIRSVESDKIIVVLSFLK